MSDDVRVLLADDQALVRAGFRALLDAQPGIAVVGEAKDGAEAARLAEALAPDVVLMDIRMPGVDGVVATEQILASGFTGTRVVMLTTFDLDEYVYAALRAGASGFLLKDTPPARIVEAVQRVAAGEEILSPTVLRRFLARFAADGGSADRARADFAKLTEREADVVLAVARGRTNQEIAEELFLSVATVKTHISHAMTKLDLANRTQLALLAHDAGQV